MPAFYNQAAFDDPRSRMRAIGTDLSPARAIVDAHGKVVAHARTGGMIDPARHELKPRTQIFRFGAADRSPRDVAKGGWWIEKREFQLLTNFAISNDIYIGLAMRLLCLVPPEWSDATVLIKANVVHSLLAWRGLGNSVVTPMKGGLGTVRMPHQNDISARRVHQLFIPGLDQQHGVEGPISIQDAYPLDPAHSNQGFLYL